MTSLPGALWVIPLLALIASATAQEPAETAERRNLAGSQSVPGDFATAETGIIPAMEGDDEFGEQVVIERASNWYPLSIQAYLGAFRTSNAELADGDGMEDNYLRGGAAVQYTPAIRGNLFADLGVTEETYRYDDLGDLDFDYLRSHAGFFYFVPPDDSLLGGLLGNGFLFANYAWYRVSDGLFDSAVFANHSAVLGYQKAIPIRKGHQIYFGLATDLSFSANDDDFQRHEHRAYAGYTVEWTEDFLTRAGYAGSWFDYLHNNQGDWNHVIEVLATWVVARPVILGTEGEFYLEGSASFTLNDSNVVEQDYEYFNFGGGLGFRTSF